MQQTFRAATRAPTRTLDLVQVSRLDSIDPCPMHTATDFDQLLQSAAVQPEPQQLLYYLFAPTELPVDATPAQHERFVDGGGCTLSPVVCLDKGLDELSSFKALVTETRAAQGSPDWQESQCKRSVACGASCWAGRPQCPTPGCRTGRAGTTVDGCARAQRPDQALPGTRRGRRNVAILLNRSAAPLQQLAKRMTHLTTQIIREEHSALLAT